MATEQVMITVKTYPTLSKRYVETVCTAGVTTQGEWRRLYPIRFRYLEDEKKYKIYDCVELKVSDVSPDGRPESRRPQTDTLRVIRSVKNWQRRHEWIRPTIFESMAQMKQAGRSIGAVQVCHVKDFLVEEDEPDWTIDQQEQLRQQGLWGDDEPKRLEKIPYRFRLVWKDGDGEEHNHLFISWEVCQTWRSFHLKYDDALSMVREKWMRDRFGADRRVVFFMGNMAQYRDTFMVCGTHTPPLAEISNETLF